MKGMVRTNNNFWQGHEPRVDVSRDPPRPGEAAGGLDEGGWERPTTGAQSGRSSSAHAHSALYSAELGRSGEVLRPVAAVHTLGGVGGGGARFGPGGQINSFMTAQLLGVIYCNVGRYTAWWKWRAPCHRGAFHTTGVSSTASQATEKIKDNIKYYHIYIYIYIY